MKPKPPLEKDIQKAICDYLELKRHFFWRQNTAPMFQKDSGVYRALPKYAMKGVPDIILIYKGKFWGLEVKRPGNKISEDQEIFRDGCQSKGGLYHVVMSIDDVIALGL